jgi:hypothetical protein
MVIFDWRSAGLPRTEGTALGFEQIGGVIFQLRLG